MSKFKLHIEYEGTRYSGWQMQKNSKTVQGKIFDAADEIFGRGKCNLMGSGRTDAGVHALNQVAHLDVDTMLGPEIIRMKLNDLLPFDINILEVEKVDNKFHARHSAEERSYIYQIAKRRTAFGKPYVWWIKDDLDVQKMKKAAILFEGMNDFVSFCDIDDEEKSTKVLLNKIEFLETDSLIVLRISGSHFLWKMVRRIVGMLVEIGRGKQNENDIIYYLKNRSNEPAKFTAPPSGLFLESVFYEKNPVYKEIKPTINMVPVVYNKKNKKRK
jgi:tRNA pseudouridine38-40 synthase